MADGTPSAENVIAVSFEADANAYEALTALKELDAQDRLHIQGAAVVVRSEDGGLDVKDQVAVGSGGVLTDKPPTCGESYTSLDRHRPYSR